MAYKKANAQNMIATGKANMDQASGLMFVCIMCMSGNRGVSSVPQMARKTEGQLVIKIVLG